MIDRAGLYPESVDFTEVYHSTTQGPDRPVQAIIRTKDDLQKLLPGIPAPGIDFGKQQLIAVALGDQGVSVCDVRITSVMYLTDRLQGRPPLTIISYTDTEKEGSSGQPCRPVHVVSTRPLEGETEFEKTAAP